MKLIILLLCITSIIVFSGCEVFSKAKQDAENFTGSIIKTKNDIEELGTKLDETIKEAQLAADKINQAKEALNQITE